jgi:hypothetical protein
LGLSKQHPRKKPKKAPDKVLVARLLRKQTTKRLQWMPDRLQMGTAGYLSNVLAAPKKGGKKQI